MAAVLCECGRTLECHLRPLNSKTTGHMKRRVSEHIWKLQDTHTHALLHSQSQLLVHAPPRTSFCIYCMLAPIEIDIFRRKVKFIPSYFQTPCSFCVPKAFSNNLSDVSWLPVMAVCQRVNKHVSRFKVVWTWLKTARTELQQRSI